VHCHKVDSDNADSLRVIGAGLPRTGTSSLKAALELLGFGPCHHMSELFDKSKRCVEFIRAYDGSHVDFNVLMKGYGSTVNLPASDFYKEIHQAHPQAKIILTVRENSEKWFESVSNTILTVHASYFYFLTIYPIRFLRLQCIVCRKSYTRWMAEYGDIGPWIHDRYNARVINENKEGDVLVFNVKDGWGPLCKFLGVDIPKDIPFPNVHDTQQLQRSIRLAKIMGSCAWLFLAIMVGLVVYFFTKLTT
jgi:hypothetical protein